MKKAQPILILILIASLLFVIIRITNNNVQQQAIPTPVNYIQSNGAVFFECTMQKCISINREDGAYNQIKTAVVTYLEKEGPLSDDFLGAENYTCGAVIAGYDTQYVYAWHSCSGFMYKIGGIEQGTAYGFGTQKFEYKVLNNTFIITDFTYPKKGDDRIICTSKEYREKCEEKDKAMYGSFYEILNTYPIPDRNETYDDIEVRGKARL